MSTQKKWIVLAISGVSNGGKTSIMELIKKEYPDTVTFSQDVYFLEKDDPRHIYIEEINHANWDVITSLDMERLYNEVNNKLSESPSSLPGLIVVEGHLILNYKPLADLFDLKYFFTLTQEECWERRKNRVYDPPDPPHYFEKCMWPMYLMYKEELKNDEDIVYLNGTQQQALSFGLIKSKIEEAIKNWER